MQDLIAFRKQYLDSHLEQLFDFVTWKEISNLVSDNYICGVLKEATNEKLNFMGKFHDVISRYPMPAMAALASRLAEIGVRTTFIIIALVANLLLEELEIRLEEQEEILIIGPFKEHQISKDLDKWKCQYDLVVLFVEQINRCFSFILLLTAAIDFIVLVTEFQNIRKYSFVNSRAYFKCAHGLLRVLAILAASNRIELKVTCINI